MSPLPSTKPIPDGWDAHHRPAASAAMTATCIITRPTIGAYNASTLQYAANTNAPVYVGPCRIQEKTSAAHAADVAGQLVTTRQYLVAVEHDADQVLVDDIVTVTNAVDALLIGRPLRVLDVQYGSHQWQRDLTCEDFEG